MRFSKKVVAVTGAAGGIGKEIVRQFAAEDAHVVLVDIKSQEIEQAAKELVLPEGRYLGVAADVSDEAQVQRYVRAAVDQFGRIDIFVNNAGIEGAIAPIADYPVDKLDAVIAINFRGAFLGLKYVLQVMQKQKKGGSIVNMSSIGGLRGMPMTSAYVATKFAMVGLTKAAAVEYAPKNIRVNAVCPSPINTRMMRSIESGTGNARAKAMFTQMIPMHRYGEADEIAAAVLFLSSDHARFINGAILPVDGGMSAA